MQLSSIIPEYIRFDVAKERGGQTLSRGRVGEEGARTYKCNETLWLDEVHR